MKLYLTVIGAAMVLISAFNIACGTAPWYYVVIAVVLCTAAQFALDGLVAIIISKMPNRLFRAGHPLYEVHEAEKKFYQKIKVRNWKDRVWELGGLGGFSKKKLAEPGSAEYIERFIIECNKGVLTHRLSYFVGFLPMLLFGDICALTIALPVAVVNLFLNILPTLALRYNTPKLQAMLKRLNRKEQRTKLPV